LENVRSLKESSVQSIEQKLKGAKAIEEKITKLESSSFYISQKDLEQIKEKSGDNFTNMLTSNFSFNIFSIFSTTTNTTFKHNILPSSSICYS